MTDKTIEVPAEFVEWVKREIPPGTVISDPEWWASRIYRALLRAAAQPECRSIDCGGDENAHTPSCKWMQEMHTSDPLTELLANQQEPDAYMRRATSEALRDMYNEAPTLPSPAGEELRRDALQNLRKELSLAVTNAREMFHAEGSMYHEGRRVAYEQCLQWLDDAIAAEKREG